MCTSEDALGSMGMEMRVVLCEFEGECRDGWVDGFEGAFEEDGRHYDGVCIRFLLRCQRARLRRWRNVYAREGGDEGDL